ncbi:MAG: hypothetical protein GQ524_07620 [Anaerolineales bacterium]|nr:hypothetical protein [Anaerolineales bacterium]
MTEGIGAGPIIDTLTRGGALGVMAVGLWAFLTGRIVSQKSHEESIADQKEIAKLVAESMGEAICTKIESGVAKGMKEGIAEGYLEINGRRDNA